MTDGDESWLIVGLGNPGPQYERTRHNVGFRVVDVLADRLAVTLRSSKHRAAVGDGRDRGRRLTLAKPVTYMNESGQAVAPLVRYYRIPSDRIVVVHDDLDLELASIRVKAGGGTGGHRGLESLVRALGTPAFARVRIGIGRPPGRQDPVDYVLEPFRKADEEVVGVAVEEGADAVLTVVHDGVAAAQNRFHAPRA